MASRHFAICVYSFSFMDQPSHASSLLIQLDNSYSDIRDCTEIYYELCQRNWAS